MSRFSLLLLASTALSAALGLPALAAMQAQGTPQGPCSGICTAVFTAQDGAAPLLRVSDDDDDRYRQARRRHDDDDPGDCDGDDDDEDDDCAGARRSPARAGSMAPPANGLFSNGAPPVAVTN